MRPTGVHTIELCELCLLRNALNAEEAVCLAQRDTLFTHEELQYLMQYMPFARWQTPKALGEAHGYSSKQIIRLVSRRENRIVSTLVDGRWFILDCSFANFLRRHHRP